MSRIVKVICACQLAAVDAWPQDRQPFGSGLSRSTLKKLGSLLTICMTPDDERSIRKFKNDFGLQIQFGDDPEDVVYRKAGNETWFWNEANDPRNTGRAARDVFAALLPTSHPIRAPRPIERVDFFRDTKKVQLHFEGQSGWPTVNAAGFSYDLLCKAQKTKTARVFEVIVMEGWNATTVRGVLRRSNREALTSVTSWDFGRRSFLARGGDWEITGLRIMPNGVGNA